MLKYSLCFKFITLYSNQTQSCVDWHWTSFVESCTSGKRRRSIKILLFVELWKSLQSPRIPSEWDTMLKIICGKLIIVTGQTRGGGRLATLAHRLIWADSTPSRRPPLCPLLDQKVLYALKTSAYSTCLTRRCCSHLKQVRTAPPWPEGAVRT